MDKHSLGLLEFRHIRNSLAQSCMAEAGRSLVQTQPILTDPDAVLELRRPVVELHLLLDSGEEIPHLDFPDFGRAQKRLEKRGGILEEGELARMGRFFRSAGVLRRYLKKQTLRPTLPALGEEIPESRDLETAIFRIVDPEGRLREKQIPELKEIAGRLDRLRKQVIRLADGCLSDPDHLSYWQDRQPVQRNGRTVLPLKANFRGRIPSVVHELSGSGATLFIEPLDMVEPNNAVVEAREEYRNTVRRILSRLTTSLAEKVDQINRIVDRIAFIDTLLARARYAVKNRCTAAKRSDDRLILLDARHPLLGADAVPVTIRLEQGCRMLVVTGPNMGGKTVSLKTVGLLSLMNQFGMEIPAAPGSELPIFDGCLADIGDEQSIQQSLSTFAAHVSNLSRMVSRATSRSLVLLDELGAGTDPEEGTAIAMALLDAFIDRRSFALVTTHHGILKIYGYTRGGVENASMEFDRKSLRPTYKILTGIPGESHALEIARQVGMGHRIVAKAQGYLRDERNDISELLARLTAKERELLETEARHKKRENELERKRRQADKRLDALLDRERELREKGIAELRSYLDRSRIELDGLVRSIREGELTREKTGKASAFLAEVREELRRQMDAVKEVVKPGKAAADFTPRPGMTVQIRSSGKRATVVRKDKGERWIVETDRLKISLEPGELEALESEAQEETILATSIERESPAAYELDVRGLRYEEAIQRLAKQIDSAVLAGLLDFGVIHGKGEGILQRAVHQYLSEHSAVKEYSFAPPEQGGFGRTVVRLKG